MTFEINRPTPKGYSAKLGKPKEKEFRRQEARVAKFISGHQTKASGASSSKGDCFNSVFRIECKSTEKKSILIKKEWLDKISREARETNRDPGLSFQFNDSAQRWVAVPEDLFQKMFQYCYDNNKDLFL